MRFYVAIYRTVQERYRLQSRWWEKATISSPLSLVDLFYLMTFMFIVINLFGTDWHAWLMRVWTTKELDRSGDYLDETFTQPFLHGASRGWPWRRREGGPSCPDPRRRRFLRRKGWQPPPPWTSLRFLKWRKVWSSPVLPSTPRSRSWTE